MTRFQRRALAAAVIVTVAAVAFELYRRRGTPGTVDKFPDPVVKA